ncbi:DHHC palmitoyltransferase-domain-containing protein [Calycina marina]|uniref:Palmitoyltransferase n=1 Tax=Calycina marina TaxID=1763456 RepID=A0A9P7YWH2_9HELO|nr:DHHC palmitoyltransferase-domain-containing protein [Calycina marina]
MSASSNDMDAPSGYTERFDGGDVASVLSSRMTDIASNEGDTRSIEPVKRLTTRLSRATPDGSARPTTGGISGDRRAIIAGGRDNRGSVTSNFSTTHRPHSSMSRSHVPSLSSRAFSRPMSSQRLQAQRGSSRTGFSQPGIGGVGLLGGSVARSGIVPNDTSANRQSIVAEGEMWPPPSRGTEMTEHTVDQTAQTSPTQGHCGTGSLSESVRPLQKSNSNPKGLSVNTEKGYKNGSGIPTPGKSPRSFRSGFLTPSRGDFTPHSPNRNTHGREKIPSNASSPGITPTTENQKPIEHSPKQKKNSLGSNYEYFTGNTVFCWGGRFQNTQEKPINLATGLMIFIPGVLFYVFSAPWLWHHVSPALPIVFAYVWYICMSSFIHASVSDPGILPRNLHPFPPPDENEDPLRLAPPTIDWTLIKSAQSPSKAMEVPTKYCKTCNIWRPPRGHHCRICDNCIETQDHHCVWINNCVGRRNYRYFFTLLVSSTIMSYFLVGASIGQIVAYQNQQGVSFTTAISHFRVPFAMFIYGILASLYPLALTVYHLFLMGRGETTREYLNGHKFLPKDRHRPFTQESIIKNWFVVICRPRPPTYLRFKQKYEEGDQRFGERRGERTAPLIEDAQSGHGAPALEMKPIRPSSRGFEVPAALKRNDDGS